VGAEDRAWRESNREALRVADDDACIASELKMSLTKSRNTPVLLSDC